MTHERHSPDESGESNPCRTALWDITDSKGVENALVESECQMKSILAASPVGIIHTRNRRIVWANSTFEKMFGFHDDQEYVGQPTSIMHPSEVAYENVRSRLYDNVGKGEVSEAEAMLRRKDGSVFEAHIRISLLDPQDPTLGTISAITDISEGKALEMALRESEEKYRFVVEHVHEGIALGQDGTLRFINRAVLEISGYEETELLSKPFSEFIHPDDRDMALQYHFRRLQRDVAPSRHAFRIIRKDGNIRSVEVNAGLVHWEGRPAVLTSLTDITDRKKAEEALRHSQERLELALRGADLGLWDLDLTTGQGVVNQRMLEIIGYSPGEVETRLDIWQQFIHPDDIGFVREHLKEHFQGGTDFVDHEYRVRTKSGQYVWVLARGKIVQRGVDSKPLRFAGTVMDITDRKRADEKLRENEERYRYLVENIEDLICTHDLQGNLLFVSSGPAHLLEMDPADMVGTNLRSYLAPEVADQFDGYLATIQRDGRASGLMLVQGSSGDKRLWDYRNKLLRESSGASIVLGVARDVTERKRAEKEKERLRTQLLHSQKMATMGTLATGIAHDFNNLLTVILGYSSYLLADKDERDPGYKELQKIVKTSQDAADLVERIRIFGRKAEIRPVPLDLNHQIDEATKLLSRSLPKMIEMDIRLAKDRAIINADASHIAQMVMNLAVNAGEAMPQGGRLTIQTENVILDDDYCSSHAGLNPGPHVVLTVSDTGGGIEKGLLERIFDPFYSTKTRDYRKGTGLGLSVVQGIVQQHGGHITVESQIGHGTTFRVFFPAVEGEEPPEHVELEIPLSAGERETILLVEDEEMVRDLGVAILERHGYSVLVARDGSEALKVYEKEKENISLVILDIIMPRMNGKECLAKLLKMKPDAKVLISSGVAQDALIQNMVALGAKSSVQKPYGMKHLLETVRQVLDGN